MSIVDSSAIGVEQRFEIARHLARAARFGDHLARPQPAAGDDALAGLVADVDPLLGVLGLVRRPKHMHQRRAETRLAGHVGHYQPQFKRVGAVAHESSQDNAVICKAER